ncbi:hypothetical protein [Psychrobacter sp. JCM 18900]|uniref:hypothetical protein n=1 Tax=Psychrobacter sp. JCM 18900 TaxID=1298608 RepID=UPI0004AEA1A7|nr:hypothetical protein [Psychrobacter sp. JCM 18900]
MIAIVGIGVALWIETHRKNPMLQVRWMRSRNIIAFMITGAVMRILLSEQNVGAAGYLPIWVMVTISWLLFMLS